LATGSYQPTKDLNWSTADHVSSTRTTGEHIYNRVRQTYMNQWQYTYDGMTECNRPIKDCKTYIRCHLNQFWQL